MKKRLLSMTCLCALLLALSVGSAPASATGSLQFHVLPVTEASVRTLYGWEGYEVIKITPNETDFLVEYTDYGKPGDVGRASLLDWVFGTTGRRVQLGSMETYTSYDIAGPGYVVATTNGVSTVVPWKGMPETKHFSVLGGPDGVLTEGQFACIENTETSWLSPKEPFYMGWWDGTADSESDRYEQLYDARVDVDGLSFSFIPSGDPDRFTSFFPAVTTVPAVTTAYDEGTGVLTLRLHNTCLKSGGIEKSEYQDFFGGTLDPYHVTYPYEFPAGSLGRDNHFLKNVQVVQDGEDAVVTGTLTDRAYRFTVEQGNLGYDNIPVLRIRFREYHSELDKT